MPEIQEPVVALRSMTAGGEVVEDYRHVSLSLRAHPVSFLRPDLRRRRIVTCSEAMEARDGRWLEAAGIVLVRQRPGSAKGVMGTRDIYIPDLHIDTIKVKTRDFR